MLFNTLTFAVFLVIVLGSYYALSHRWQNRMLLVASYIFYGAWDWRFLSLLGASTVIDYFVALAVARATITRHRRAWLGLSLVANLGILGTFKYLGFFVDSLNRLLASAGWGPLSAPLQVILPVGISFYTFQTMSYVIDVYRRQQKPASNLLDFALYVAYFPQLVAGPIERARNLLPRICNPRTVTPQQIGTGLQLMLMGYVKKVAIADAIAPYVERIFADPAGQSSLQLLVGLYLFAIQIYGDFSGYSDIARGVSRLFGIELMVNFKQPYLSANITEFWRRWHISLSTWLRDYLYIPLGGNRRGALATYRNLMATMLLGGLWHGASWTFVVWGGLHGLGLCVHRLVLGGRKVVAARPALHTWGDAARLALRVVLTFHLVCLTWLFFRAASFEQAWLYLTGLVQGTATCPVRLLAVTGFYALLMLIIDVPCWAGDRELPVAEQTPWYVTGIAQAAAVILLSFVGESHVMEFIYFQF